MLLSIWYVFGMAGTGCSFLCVVPLSGALVKQAWWWQNLWVLACLQSFFFFFLHLWSSVWLDMKFWVESSFLFYCLLGFGLHVRNVQNSCIGTYMAVCFAAFCPLTHIWHFSPCYPSPAPPPHCPSPIPYNRPQCIVLACVHVFSLFITRLWVRICSVSFSVLVSVCWEWRSPDSSMSLQWTQTHHFWLLHNISWCICATFSQTSLSSMSIWVGSRSLLS